MSLARTVKRDLSHALLAWLDRPLMTLLFLGCLLTSAGCRSHLPPSALADGIASEALPPRLVAACVGTLPPIDGEIESDWEDARPLALPLQWGIDGTAHALDITLRAVYNEEALAFLATWDGEPPSEASNLVRNRVVVHWPIPAPENGKTLNCMVSCHTAFADGRGQFTYVAPETIPPGTSGSLPVGGGWDGSRWIMEWSRPLTNHNPYDLQFTDLDSSYRFFVKLLQHVEARPDPVSEWCFLTFES